MIRDKVNISYFHIILHGSGSDWNSSIREFFHAWRSKNINKLHMYKKFECIFVSKQTNIKCSLISYLWSNKVKGYLWLMTNIFPNLINSENKKDVVQQLLVVVVIRRDTAVLCLFCSHIDVYFCVLRGLFVNDINP